MKPELLGDFWPFWINFTMFDPKLTLGGPKNLNFDPGVKTG